MEELTITSPAGDAWHWTLYDERDAAGEPGVIGARQTLATGACAGYVATVRRNPDGTVGAALYPDAPKAPEICFLDPQPRVAPLVGAVMRAADAARIESSGDAWTGHAAQLGLALAATVGTAAGVRS